jgi:hypothetical protein
MIIKKESLLFRRIRRTRRSLIGIGVRRGTRHEFLETILKNRHLLEIAGWLR